MEHKLTAEDLEALRKITSPNICNAIETFNLRPSNQGFMGPEIKCILPERGTMVGFAATVVIAADQPATGTRRVFSAELMKHIQQIPAPRVLVVHDLDYPHPIGSLWGEVSSNVFKATGCIGAVTDGGVRDLDEIRKVGFHLFASTILVSHAYVHIVDFGVPVKVGGLVVKPGDLLHGDQHGVVSIPLEIAKEIPAVARKQEASEARIIEVCRSPNFTLEKLQEVLSPRPA